LKRTKRGEGMTKEGRDKRGEGRTKKGRK
jgi:hypothetical protein